MNPSENFTVIKRLFALALLSGCATAFANQAVGTVTNLSGPLFVKTESGAFKILGLQSSVGPGDTLVSEQDTYARITFIDKSEISLAPNTQIKIEKFSFNEAQKDNDNVDIRLIKGGLQVVSGLLGKRSKNRFMLNTSTSSIDMQNATLIVQYIPEETKVAAYRAIGIATLRVANKLVDGIRTEALQGLFSVRLLQSLQLAQNTPAAPSSSNLAAGLYVHVIDGAINLTNKGGSTDFSAGQFGYTANVNKTPIVVPANPGIKFTPPPTFVSTNNKSSSSSAAKAVDCEVR
jgi:hypothetical protein